MFTLSFVKRLDVYEKNLRKFLFLDVFPSEKGIFLRLKKLKQLNNHSFICHFEHFV